MLCRDVDDVNTAWAIVPLPYQGGNVAAQSTVPQVFVAEIYCIKNFPAMTFSNFEKNLLTFLPETSTYEYVKTDTTSSQQYL